MIWKQALVFFHPLLPGVDVNTLKLVPTHFGFWGIANSFGLKMLCFCVCEAQSRVQSDVYFGPAMYEKSKLRDNKK